MKKFPSAADNHSRIMQGIESYPASGRGKPSASPVAPPVKHLPAVQFGDIQAVTDKIASHASAKPPMAVNVARRAPGAAAANLPAVRGTAPAPTTATVGAAKAARK